jgi:carboxypeptidase family protein/TonB-dependent receptor-like protein
MLIGVFGVARILLLVQASQASVAGTIRDGESGQPLGNAAVALADLSRSTLTDSSGRYSFTDVPPGPQHLTIQRIGYAPRTLHALVPAEGRLYLDITLHPVPTRLPAILVRAPVLLRGMDDDDNTSFPDRRISMAAVRNDPMLAEADALLALGGGEIGINPESPSGVNIRGAASDQTGYLLDGIPVFSPYHSAGTFSAWNPDALERIQVSSTSPTLAAPDALAGTVSATLRRPSPFLRAQGAMTTSQARWVLDGPVGHLGAGYLLSYRTGFPGLVAPRNEGSYLSGSTSDLIVKTEAPLLGGKLGLLFYDADNSIGSGAAVTATPGAPSRSSFEWSTRSLGGHWSMRFRGGTLRLQGWSASSDAEATWLASGTIDLVAERRNQGALALIELAGSGSGTTAGVRLERNRTVYRAALGADSGRFDLEANEPLATVFIQHGRSLSKRLGANLGGSATAAAGAVHWGFQSRLSWTVAEPLTFTASFARTHQFSQSLRNSESVVGNVFPADLFIGVGVPGVPVARGSRAVVAADYRPTSSIRLSAQGYLVHYTGLLLVAPETGQPFATRGFTTGVGSTSGFSLDATLASSRSGFLARYGWQRARVEYGDSTYTPGYATSHVFELGAIVFPSATSSVRLGLTGGMGRRATAVSGAFEWEACNLLDRGCEFAGDPLASGPLGAIHLPSYLRLDLGLRKHWHFTVHRRDVILALFGTITNLLGRNNTLTVVTDPTTGRRTAIEMRPRSPLVLGLDWRF